MPVYVTVAVSNNETASVCTSNSISLESVTHTAEKVMLSTVNF